MNRFIHSLFGVVVTILAASVYYYMLAAVELPRYGAYATVMCEFVVVLTIGWTTYTLHISEEI